MRYRNNSNYKNDTEIRKKAYVSQAVLDELKRIIEDAEVGGARTTASSSSNHNSSLVARASCRWCHSLNISLAARPRKDADAAAVMA